MVPVLILGGLSSAGLVSGALSLILSLISMTPKLLAGNLDTILMLTVRQAHKIIFLFTNNLKDCHMLVVQHMVREQDKSILVISIVKEQRSHY